MRIFIKQTTTHEDIENDEFPSSERSGASLEESGALEPQENSENQNSKIPKSGGLEFRKSETIKNYSINNLLTKNKNNKNIDDDKRTPPSGGDSAKYTEEQINLLISNLKEQTKDELAGRSFKAVVRKVMDKYYQEEIREGKFRDYLVSSLVNKIEELEFRRATDEAKKKLKASKKERIEQRKKELEEQQLDREVPFYDWLNED